tara:strand:+ start:742 stop:1308 length:567 start_codon:yes stop_codon:yes gene_type:complete
MTRCELAKKSPQNHLIKVEGVPDDKNDFYAKATSYCNKFADCYGSNVNCLNAVKPERMGGKRRRRRSRRKRGGLCGKKCEDKMKALGLKSAITCKPCPQEETERPSVKARTAEEIIAAAKKRREEREKTESSTSRGRSVKEILAATRKKRQENGGRRRRRKSTKKKKRRRRRKSTKKKKRRRRRKSRK